MEFMIKTYTYIFCCLCYIGLVACTGNPIIASEPNSFIEPTLYATNSTNSPQNLNANSGDAYLPPTPTTTQLPMIETPSPVQVENAPVNIPEVIAASPLPNLTIAYVKNVDSGNLEHSEIWLYDTANHENQRIHSTEQGRIIVAGDLRWHPANINEIYYVQVSVDRTWRLFRHDLLLGASEPVIEAFPPGLGLIRDWSKDGNWLSLYYEDYSSNETRKNIMFINVNTGEFIIQGYIDIEWSPIEPNHYAYYAPDGRNIVISSVNEPRNLTNVPVHFSEQIMNNIDVGFTPVVRFAWQPSGQFPLFVEANGELFSFDFDINQWEKIRNFDMNTTELTWSPSGNWLVINPYNTIFVLRKDYLADHLYPLISDNDLVVVEGWVKEPESLIVSTGDKLWIMHPEEPDQQVELFDLASIGLNTGINIDIQVMP